MSTQSPTESLIMLANHLKQRHFLVTVPEQGLYPVSYLGELLASYCRWLTGEIAPASALGHWHQGRLSLHTAPIYELHAYHMALGVLAAAEADPTSYMKDQFSEALLLLHGNLAELESLPRL